MRLHRISEIPSLQYIILKGTSKNLSYLINLKLLLTF